MRPSRAALLLLLFAVPAAGEGRAAPPKARLVAPRAGDARAKALAGGGGSASTEKAVAAGLDWLARHAQEDGWDADGFPSRCAAEGKPCDGPGRGQHGEDEPCPFDGAISGLATLAFLGAGHLPGAAGDPYGTLVEESLRRLESTADVWARPIALEALAEAEVLEGKGRWHEAVLRAGRDLLAARQQDGAWAYAAGMRRGSDVPYTAFVVPALLAARDAGLELPPALGTEVDRFLESLEESKGRLAYIVDGRSFGYTPTMANAHAAVAIRELLESGTTGARHRAHLALLADKKPLWEISFRETEVPGSGRVKVQVGHLSMYQWWYGTVGLFQRGGAAWTEWFSAAKSALLPHQRPSGCARGSWDPVGQYERLTGGRVFATALGVLMLEQPYRHLRLAP